ncbi:MAG: PilC/PilY family type IV pilus protein, partial [Gammaproteobacteria bacterium]|nr:PilC/PilY family type IV pilus protein [Gammaproteobacteria bacterium]
GVSSTSGIAKLFIINIETGVVKELSTGSGSTGSPNGLSAPALVDTDNDGRADLAYAGDIDGDLWKFDLTDATASNWNTAYKLFDGPATQPITTAPDVTTHPVSGLLVMYGTGRLYTADDITNTDTQALYGIWDKGTTPASSNKLAQTFSTNEDYSNGSIGETVRTITSTTAVDWSTHTGWKIEFTAGERVLTPPQLRSGRLKATVTNPDGFTNWLVELRFDDGGHTDDTIFDLDQNLLLDTLDRVDYNLDSDLDDLVDIPMAWQRRDGNMSQVTIARIGQGQDTLFFNYLNPAIVPPSCTGDCEGGIGGGHMDVDTDAGAFASGIDGDATLGGKTMGHVHEYDDKVDRTYVDYLDIDPLGGGKLFNVDEIGIDDDEDFIILVANADLSPGSELTIGSRKINVVEYQRSIHRALAQWDGNGELKDEDGNKLILDLDELQDDDGTLRSTFDSLAIINGGLHPTITGCVNKTSSITNGRWRNGALVIQLVKRSHFTSGTPALDRVTVQNPTDMKKLVILADGSQVVLTEDTNADGDDDDATAPDYEIFGGLIVTADAEFLYESTLFWHIGDLSKLVLGYAPCYGDPLWEQGAHIERNGVPLIFFNDLLIAAGFVDVDGNADLDALLTAFDALEALGCKDISEKSGGCKKEYSALLKLVELSERIDDGDPTNDGGDPGTGLEGAGTTPVVIEGAVTTGGVTSGPNFSTGRRTWIDIMPLGNF